MTAFEREDRSFVGCGEEEYPNTERHPVPPVGWGMRDEMLSVNDRSNLLFGEEMVRRAGVDGSPLATEGSIARQGEQPTEGQITVIGDPRRMTCAQFCSAIGVKSPTDSILETSNLREYASDLFSYDDTYLTDWLDLVQMRFEDFCRMLSPHIHFRRELWCIPRPETGNPTVVTVTPSQPEQCIEPYAVTGDVDRVDRDVVACMQGDFSSEIWDLYIDAAERVARPNAKPHSLFANYNNAAVSGWKAERKTDKKR